MTGDPWSCSQESVQTCAVSLPPGAGERGEGGEVPPPTGSHLGEFGTVLQPRTTLVVRNNRTCIYWPLPRRRAPKTLVTSAESTRSIFCSALGLRPQLLTQSFSVLWNFLGDT